MCTITFAPLPGSSNDFILTSNRDEAVNRKTLLPDVYIEEGVKLLFPKDAVAGGTWIGLSEQKRVVCLMNGGFEKHIQNLPYRKSRGLVVKSLLAAKDFLIRFQVEALGQTEPFTCIVVDYEKSLSLFRLVWDGQDRHVQKLPLRNYIWASSYLYSAETRKNREQKFQEFTSGKVLTGGELIHFHSSEGEGQKEGLVIDKGPLKTCSITQVIKTSEEVRMIYKDLIQEGNPVFENQVKF